MFIFIFLIIRKFSVSENSIIHMNIYKIFPKLKYFLILKKGTRKCDLKKRVMDALQFSMPLAFELLALRNCHLATREFVKIETNTQTAQANMWMILFA